MLDNLRSRMEDFVYDVELAKRRMQGDTWTQQLIDEMSAELAATIPEMDFGDQRWSYRGTRLLPLAQPYERSGVELLSGVVCTRVLLLGENAKFYVNGPRKKRGKTVITVHPYGLEDARGWGGVSATDLLEGLLPYFI